MIRRISDLSVPVWITFYCFRRCSANNMAATLTEEERTMMMGQKPGSDQFVASRVSLPNCLPSHRLSRKPINHDF